MYRPPDSSFGSSATLKNCSQALSQLLVNITNVQYSCIIIGDLNLPHVDWSNFGISQDHATCSLIDFFANYGFVQFVNEPTRMNSLGTGGNTLDVVLSNDQLAINMSEIGEPFSTSDHCTIKFDVFACNTNSKFSNPVHNDEVYNDYPSVAPNLPIYDWRNGDYNALNTFLIAFDWNLLFAGFELTGGWGLNPPPPHLNLPNPLF